MDVRSEIPREGRYVKVATNVADRVIKELYDNVSLLYFLSFLQPKTNTFKRLSAAYHSPNGRTWQLSSPVIMLMNPYPKTTNCL
jgi:hypothetical protein